MTESITGAALISSQEIVDLDAFTIGSLYRRSRVSIVESTKLLIEAGQRLAAKKAQLDHGQWLPWLETNADILGFETRMTASRLMKAARKCNVNDTFNEENAILLNRTIWGNEEPEPIEQFPAITGPEGVCCGYDELHALVRRGVRFGNIYADPPWLYGNQGTRAATSNHYAGLTVDQLCDPNLFPISKLAADDAHLHLWTTNGFLLECPRIFEAWGFEFKSSFVWTKPQMGIGNYWRNSHEFLLTAIRGDAKRFSRKDLRSWVTHPRGRHSAKPEQVRDWIAAASPTPRLELFARATHEGWLALGDQIEKREFVSSLDSLQAAE